MHWFQAIAPIRLKLYVAFGSLIGVMALIALVAFLHTLTDERVRYDRAPFDHPSLPLPNGGTAPVMTPIFPDTPVLEDRITLPAVGAGGSGIKLGTSGTPFAHFLQPLTK